VRKRQLLPLRPEVSVDLTLYWHQWKLVSEAAPAMGRVALLDQVGLALSSGARTALKAPQARRRAAA
jgi:LysR family transcriptional regulator (chromosome initiation inhibitor)